MVEKTDCAIRKHTLSSDSTSLGQGEETVFGIFHDED